MTMPPFRMIDADNPLLSHLGDYVEISEWADVLAVDPLAGIDLSQIDGHQRDLLLASIRARVEPTADMVQIAATLQTMIWRRYAFLNPLVIENRARTMRLLGYRGKRNSEVPWLPTFADAFMVMGCTGMGKSTAIRRVLDRIPPFIIHGELPSAGWSRHLQVTYLEVKMSTGRGALMHDILAALDMRCDTSYRHQYRDPRLWPIEKLAIEVGILLTQHSVGLLVIEEIQARNFGLSPNREEMMLFILRLLNFGIPIVFVGNPLGFQGIESFSQDLNRLTENEPVHMMPFDVSSEDWSEGVGPSLWSHNLMPVRSPYTTAINQELHACCAGISGYARKTVEGTQRMTWLRSGVDGIGVEQLRTYRERSQVFLRNRDLIEGFRDKDIYKLMKFVDVPWEEYGLLWGKLTLDDIAGSGDAGTTTTDGAVDDDGQAAYRSVHHNLRAAAQAATSRRAKREKTNEKVASNLKEGDVRSATNRHMLATGLDQLRQAIQSKA